MIYKFHKLFIHVNKSIVVIYLFLDLIYIFFKFSLKKKSVDNGKKFFFLKEQKVMINYTGSSIIETLFSSICL